MKRFLFFLLLFRLSFADESIDRLNGSIYVDDESITVIKEGVIHTFVKSDEGTDHFILNAFAYWEPETFEIFTEVKDPESIAIDLGAWIGTTSIWLANHFYHVIAVEADKVSLEWLQKNLTASECQNVTICDHPVYSTAENVIFGSQTDRLNESVSCIKNKAGKPDDYVVRSITFNQLVFDYVYADETLKDRKIGFIKCDIEGGEEHILEDLLSFVYYNKARALISFHLEWWKTKKISDFASLFKFFKTDCPYQDIVEYLESHPFESILFEPL